MTITLYGTPLSLFTGKARSYFIKAGLDYREVAPTTTHYRDVVLPAAGGRQGIPTIETSDGIVIRDGTAILDHYEASAGGGFSPTMLKQNFVSRLLDVIGMEGLLRPAMHYRWNYPEQNAPMLKFHFSKMVPAHLDRDATADKTMDRMRAAGRSFGAVPETFDTVESLYESFLEVLTKHLAVYPYLLGHKPCMGDFGMLAPMYAHLGRDPAPLRLLQTKAIEVLRWVERMNRPEPDQGEFDIQGEGYLGDDEIPDTLVEVLKVLAVDFMPETEAAANFCNDWLSQQTDDLSGATAERAIGMCEFDVNGKTMKAIAQPFRFYLLQRVFEIYDEASSDDQKHLDALLKDINMSALLNCRINRQIGRANNLEVWV